MPVIAPLVTSESAGIVPGSTFQVLAGTAAVFVFKNKMTDVLPEGNYTVDAATLPGLAKLVKLDLFGARTQSGAVGFLVSREPASIDWQSGVTLSKNRAHGLTFSSLSGRATFTVSDPGVFVTSMLREASDFAKLKGDKLAQLFPTFLSGKATAYSSRVASQDLPNLAESLIEMWSEILVNQTVVKMQVDPSHVEDAKLAIHSTAGQAIASWASQHGATLTGFSVESIGEVRRAPCQACQSQSAPTGYAIFRRNISLLYIRFGHTREGNFCVPCAWKVSATENGIMLVAGWWGLIGLILTPIYMVTNIGNLIGVMTAKRLPTISGSGAFAVAGTSSDQVSDDTSR